MTRRALRLVGLAILYAVGFVVFVGIIVASVLCSALVAN